MDVTKPICIFDLDDTLVDSKMRFRYGPLAVLDEEGIPYDEKEMMDLLTPLGIMGTAEYYHRVLGVRDSTEHIAHRIEENMKALYAERIAPCPGVLSYLQDLADQGARLFVLTASPHSLADPCLERNGMSSYFERIWSVDDIGLTKADPRLFLRIAELLDASPQNIRYFDDSLTALLNAKQAGFRTYAVYAGQGEAEVDEMKEKCDAFLESFKIKFSK